MLKELIFHHIGIATYNIENTAGIYLDAGYSVTRIITDFTQNVNICFLVKESTPLIELVAPLSDGSPVSKILKTSGVTPYHTCYEVIDIYESISILKQKKFIPIIKPVPAIALENQLICFLYNKDFGLIELLQSK